MNNDNDDSNSGIKAAGEDEPSSSSMKRFYKQQKRQIIEQIVDEKEIIGVRSPNGKPPHGWQIDRLEKATLELPLKVRTQIKLTSCDVRNEETRRRKRKKQQRQHTRHGNRITGSSPGQDDDDDKEGIQTATTSKKRKRGSKKDKHDDDEEDAKIQHRQRKRSRSRLDDLPKTTNRLPRRRRTFGNGQEKPQPYIEAYETLDQVSLGRFKYSDKVIANQRTVDDLKRKLQEAQFVLQESQRELDNYDKTYVQPAKDKVVEVELQMEEILPWTKKYNMLLDYKNKHGLQAMKNLPSRVPNNKELDSLCIWCNHQRIRHKQYRQGKIKILKPHQIELLDKIGFEWNPQDKFDTNFAYLEEFKLKFGHCIVPQKYVANEKLANWVTWLRQEMNRYKRGDSDSAFHKSLTPDRIAKLNAIGFVWSVFDLTWNKIYDKLKVYQELHGHCNVPKNYSQDKELGSWVIKQREQHRLYKDPATRKSRKCKFTEERLTKLQSIGFQFDSSNMTGTTGAAAPTSPSRRGGNAIDNKARGTTKTTPGDGDGTAAGTKTTGLEGWMDEQMRTNAAGSRNFVKRTNVEYI